MGIYEGTKSIVSINIVTIDDRELDTLKSSTFTRYSKGDIKQLFSENENFIDEAFDNHGVVNWASKEALSNTSPFLKSPTYKNLVKASENKSVFNDKNIQFKIKAQTNRNKQALLMNIVISQSI